LVVYIIVLVTHGHTNIKSQGSSVHFHNSVPNEVMGGEFYVKVQTVLSADFGQVMLCGWNRRLLAHDVV